MAWVLSVDLGSPHRPIFPLLCPRWPPFHQHHFTRTTTYFTQFFFNKYEIQNTKYWLRNKRNTKGLIIWMGNTKKLKTKLKIQMYMLWKFRSREILTVGCILLHCVAHKLKTKYKIPTTKYKIWNTDLYIMEVLKQKFFDKRIHLTA